MMIFNLEKNLTESNLLLQSARS